MFFLDYLDWIHELWIIMRVFNILENTIFVFNDGLSFHVNVLII